MSEVPCSRACSEKLVCRRVERGGKTYRCARVLAEALGLSRSAVYQSLHKYGDAEHCGVRKGVKDGWIGNNRRVVKMGPHEWPSVTAMAKDLGVDRSRLSMKLGRDPDWVLAKVLAWSARKERR